MSPDTRAQPQTGCGTGTVGGTGDGVTVSKRSVECNVLYTHCSVHGSRFLHPEGLHHLEDVHYSLRLAPLNGGGYGTEHARAAHRVTAGNTHSAQSHTMLLEY